ncbi:MAG: NusG domain II-containing protein [Ruminococcaceae bacterium]|nr:NusG domain II-containing protein [Oscillospiraceae bacterium]
MLKTRTWIIGFAAVAVVLAVLAIRLSSPRSEGNIAVISQDGKVLREIDLSRVTEEYRFTVETDDGGSNEILVQPGRICVSEADCPDKICVKQGWLTDSPLPIVCAPHKLVIEIKGAADAVDAAAR